MDRSSILSLGVSYEPLNWHNGVGIKRSGGWERATANSKQAQLNEQCIWLQNSVQMRIKWALITVLRPAMTLFPSEDGTGECELILGQSVGVGSALTCIYVSWTIDRPISNLVHVQSAPEQNSVASLGTVRRVNKHRHASPTVPRVAS